MANNGKSDKSVNDIYNESVIPPNLLLPGQAIWRFKSYFGQLKPKRPPKSNSILDKNKDWIVKVHVIEPKEVTFYGKSRQKRMAETIAMAKCLMWLRDNSQYLIDFVQQIKLILKFCRFDGPLFQSCLEYR